MFPVNKLSKLFLLLFLSCNSVNSREDLMDFLNNSKNGLIQTKTLDNKVSASFRYHPIDLLVLNEIKQNKNQGKEYINEITNNYKGNIYFDLFINTEDKELATQGYDAIKYLNIQNLPLTTMSERLKLITSEMDTLYPLDCIYSPIYGMGKNTELLFVFENKIKSTVKYIDLELNCEILNNGKLQFRFDMSLIKKSPKLLQGI